MKTYLLNTINRIKRFSESLDISTILCDKSWVVFNDTDDKEVLIFQNDGSVLITNNGIGVNKTWEWVPENKSLIINLVDDSIVMLHPEFVNNKILALELDGTNNFSFLIDENNIQDFEPKTFSELKQYFEDIERKAIEAEQKTIKEKQHIEKLNKVIKKFDIAKSKFIYYMFFSITLTIIICFIVYISTKNIVTTLIVAFIALFIAIFSVIIFSVNFYPKIRAKKYIKEHPKDKDVPYIKEAFKIK